MHSSGPILHKLTNTNDIGSVLQYARVHQTITRLLVCQSEFRNNNHVITFLPSKSCLIFRLRRMQIKTLARYEVIFSKKSFEYSLKLCQIGRFHVNSHLLLIDLTTAILCRRWWESLQSSTDFQHMAFTFWISKSIWLASPLILRAASHLQSHGKGPIQMGCGTRMHTEVDCSVQLPWKRN